eukprot:gene9877-9392_t
MRRTTVWHSCRATTKVSFNQYGGNKKYWVHPAWRGRCERCARAQKVVDAAQRKKAAAKRRSSAAAAKR